MSVGEEDETWDMLYVLAQRDRNARIGFGFVRKILSRDRTFIFTPAFLSRGQATSAEIDPQLSGAIFKRWFDLMKVVCGYVVVTSNDFKITSATRRYPHRLNEKRKAAFGRRRNEKLDRRLCT